LIDLGSGSQPACFSDKGLTLFEQRLGFSALTDGIDVAAGASAGTMVIP
jgi:hypothetical protein